VIRDGKLHGMTFMRANDAYRGTVSDVFSFTFLQELLAHQLGCELGSYTHVAGSYHLYESDRVMADRVLADRTRSLTCEPFPTMPRGDNWPAIYQVLTLEHALRTRRQPITLKDIDAAGLPSYWAQVVTLLALHARHKREGIDDPELLEYLCPFYRSFVENARAPRPAPRVAVSETMSPQIQE
jgi:thymidylate synthase